MIVSVRKIACFTHDPLKNRCPCVKMLISRTGH